MNPEITNQALVELATRAGNDALRIATLTATVKSLEGRLSEALEKLNAAEGDEGGESDEDDEDDEGDHEGLA